MGKTTSKTAKARAWKACSKYIRLKHADNGGFCVCVTCGTTKHYTEMHAGHFIPRRKTPTFAMEENIHPQCPGCNTFNAEKAKIHYTRYMQDLYGDEFVAELLELAEETVRMRAGDWLEIEAEYKRKLAEL